MRERVELEPAYVLVRRPYRETSQLLEIFSEHHGRLALVARGTRGERRRSALDLFTPYWLSWNENGEVGTLTASEPAAGALTLTGERVFHGWYLNELLTRLVPRHDPHPELYQDYVATLAALAGAAAAAEAALRIFEKRLLEQIGYGLPLAEEFLPQQHYRFGGDAFVASDERGACVFVGASLNALRDEALEQRAALDDARRLLRLALEPHVPRAELQTPQLLRQMRDWSGQSSR